MTQVTVQGTVPAWTLTDRLRKAREVSGLSQTELGEATGLSRRSIAGYEGGEREPRRPVLIAWALATGVSLDWLNDEGPRRDDEGPAVRPKGLEPPTFWTVVRRIFARNAGRRLTCRSSGSAPSRDGWVLGA